MREPADNRRYFEMLDRQEQAAAIRRLAASRMSDYGIAAATGLAVEQVRRVLAERVELDETSA
jgi:hypothetical protein